MVMHYGNGNTRGLDRPAATVLANDKHNLTTAFLYNPQWGGTFRSIDRPCFTIIARMDKAPPHLATVQYATIGEITIHRSDSRYTKRIKGFMLRNSIIDIKMRMLHVEELLRIQGFPKDYVLKGTKTEQKKYIGNAVEVNMAAALARAAYQGLSLNRINQAL
jgi:DNA (cytosine-5)-methyltransferase 1